MSKYLDFIREFRLGINEYHTLSAKETLHVLAETQPEHFEDLKWVSMHLALDIQRIIAKNPHIDVQEMFTIIEANLSDDVYRLTNKIYQEDNAGDHQLVSKIKLEHKLNEIIGLHEVKHFINKLRAQIRIRQEREKLGLQTNTAQTLHMVFKGNPGTGKTTIARIVGELLYDMGILKTRKFIETDRAGLIGRYLGETAQKTVAKVQEALDGVLFIDEAYSLMDNYADGSGYGKESIDTLVKSVEDYRERLIVILAGYSSEMDEFMEMNPGLKSRFPNVIEFPDYTVDELMLMTQRLFAKNDYTYSSETEEYLRNLFLIAKENPQFGNGRYVRNLFENALRNQALRLDHIHPLTRDELVTIKKEDIDPMLLT